MHDVIRLKQVDHVKNEKNILSEIHHPFIVDLLWFHKDKNLLYMLFPYVCGGELFSYLRRLLQITLTSLIYGDFKISANYSTKVCDNSRGFLLRQLCKTSIIQSKILLIVNIYFIFYEFPDCFFKTISYIGIFCTVLVLI